MSSIDEKRVYRGEGDETGVYVATDLGVARVAVSGEQVGAFGLAERCTARDVARVPARAVPGRETPAVAVATDRDVLLGDGEGFAPTAFGPATAVGAGEALLAASPEGQVARFAGASAASTSDEAWTALGDAGGPVRAIDGDLVATADGVRRVGDGLTDAGLTDVRDVAAAGRTLLAAAGDGCYRLGNGWMRDREGPHDAVAAAGDGRAACVAEDGTLALFADGWTTVDVPATPAAVGFGETVYAVGADGTFCLRAFDDDGWRTQALGLPGCRSLAVLAE